MISGGTLAGNLIDGKICNESRDFRLLKNTIHLYNAL